MRTLLFIAAAIWGSALWAADDASDPYSKFYQAAAAAGANGRGEKKPAARMPVGTPFFTPPAGDAPAEGNCEARLSAAPQAEVANSVSVTAPAKFRLRYFKNRRSGETIEMLELTEPHLMTFAYFPDGRSLKVYLRPQAAGLPISDPLAEIGRSGYEPQPVTFSFAENENPRRRVMRVLKTVAPSALHLFPRKFAAEFYPSPDSMLVNSRSLFIRLKAPLHRKIFDWEAWDAANLIQRLEETGAVDGILELNLHHLLQESQTPPPPWAGKQISLKNLDSSRLPQVTYSLRIEPRRNWRMRRWFAPSGSERWEFFSGDIQEVNAQGGPAAKRMEYAVSRMGSANQISMLPVKKINSRVWVGLKTIDTPVSQMYGEGSVIWALPTWRVYTGETSLKTALKDTSLRFEREFDTPIISVQALGASFRTEPAVSADLIYPYIAEVDPDARFQQRLAWFPLDRVMTKLSEIKDARLLITLYRLEQATR